MATKKALTKAQWIALDSDFDSLYELVENEFDSYEQAHDEICQAFNVDPEQMAQEMGCKDAYGILAYLVDQSVNG